METEKSSVAILNCIAVLFQQLLPPRSHILFPFCSVVLLSQLISTQFNLTFRHSILEMMYNIHIEGGSLLWYSVSGNQEVKVERQYCQFCFTLTHFEIHLLIICQSYILMLAWRCPGRSLACPSWNIFSIKFGQKRLGYRSKKNHLKCIYFIPSIV